jgi:hypothetical protein
MRNGLRFGEVVIAGDAATGIIFDRYNNECEARLDGECVRSHALAKVCARALSMQGVHLAFSFISDKPVIVAAAPQEAQAAALPVAPIMARHSATERETATQPRCRHYRAIKACFAVFIARGLTTDDEAMRATLGRLLERDVPTRKALTANDWEAAASAAKWLAA